jgi:meiotically up-regulated gene 157 (Mug157) protein
LLHRLARAIAISLAVSLSPALALGEQAPSQQYIVVPQSSINPKTILIPTSVTYQTLSGDFFRQDDGTMYVQTGDIPAMWLRDSSAQTKTYVRFVQEFPKAAPLVRAVIERNAKNVLTDPYANAFTAGYKIWEEKWEVDSLAYPVTLAYTYWRLTGDRAMFTERLHWALEHSVSTLVCEQHHATCSRYRSRFLTSGRGADFMYTGMIWSAFRPSDDPVRYPYNIPQNMFTVVALRELADLVAQGYGDAKLAQQAAALADQVDNGIQRYGRVYNVTYGWMYAYEVDGMGHTLFMDDANVPDLIAATYFGYVTRRDPFYANTRRFALSKDNPYFYSGKLAAGLGSPHTPTGYIWPLGVATQGLTAQSPAETAQAIRIETLTMNTGALFHESFDPDDPDRFTRTSFGWADAMFAELIFRSAAGFDADPLPPIPGMSFENPASETPVVVDPPQLWLNRAACFDAAARVLQQS